MPSENDFKFESLSMKKMFGTNHVFYSIPSFQRGFVWRTTTGEGEGERFWKDIDELLDTKDTKTFLGCIVLDQQDSEEMFNTYYTVIDGQQRITTLYAFIWALMRQCEVMKIPESVFELKSILTISRETETDTEYLPKLIPDVYDRKTFRGRMSKLSSYYEDQNKKNKHHMTFRDQDDDHHNQLLEKMFNYQLTRIKKRVKGLGELKQKKNIFNDHQRGLIGELTEIALNRFTFVSILPPEEYDINKVFQTLNEGGMDLTTADLVRNLIFWKMSDDADAAVNLHKSSWKPFEDSLKSINDKSMVDYFNRFGMIKHQATTNKVFAELKAEWKDWKPDKIIEELSEYVAAYRALKIGASKAYYVEVAEGDVAEEEAAEEDVQVNPFKEIEMELERWIECGPPNSMDPYTIQLLHHFEQEKCKASDVSSCLSLLESFLVRRSFCSIEGTGLNALFKNLWDEKRAEKAGFDIHDSEYIRGEIEKHPHIKFPYDSDFQLAVKGDGENFYSRKMSLFVCRQLEIDKMGPKGNQISDLPTPTKEHIVPNTYAPKNKDWDYEITKEEHDNWKDTWANITLLTKPANGQIQDKGWSKKGKYYDEKSLYVTSKEIGNKEKNNVMGIAFIKKRADTLAKWAVKRWPR